MPCCLSFSMNRYRRVRRAAVCVFPSYAEAQPLAWIEAMACALPVVAVSATGATNLVHDGETGSLAEPGDTCALANALERLGLARLNRIRGVGPVQHVSP